VPNTLAEVCRELALANRIVANEGVLDAYGHVSMRHPDDPDRYLLSRSLAPELVTPDDLIEYDLDSRPVRDTNIAQYSERVIHGEIYKARPDVMSVCHHHAPAFMPLLATRTDYVPVFALGSIGGSKPPFWDQRDEFGDTNLLVVKPAEGAALARALGHHWMPAPACANAPTGRSFPAATPIFRCAPWRSERWRNFRPVKRNSAPRSSMSPPAFLAHGNTGRYASKRSAAGCSLCLKKRPRSAPRPRPASAPGGGAVNVAVLWASPVGRNRC
jgi:hypothetical protein